MVSKSPKNSITVTATLTNTGSMASDEVVQVYVSWELAGAGAGAGTGADAAGTGDKGGAKAAKHFRVPVRQLAAFTRLHAIPPSGRARGLQVPEGEGEGEGEGDGDGDNAGANQSATRKVEFTLPAERYALVDAQGLPVLPAGGKMTVTIGGVQPTKYSEAAGKQKCISAVIQF